MGAEEDDQKLKKVFKSIFFVGFWVYGFASVCLFELLEPFVAISFGEQYIFSVEVTFLLCLNFYLTGVRQAVISFRDSLGLFWYDRYKSIIEAVINLVTSIVLALYFGTAGVFLGTLVSTVLVPLWLEPYVLYKHRMKQPLKNYFIKLGVYTLVMLLGGVLTHVICSYIEGNYVRQLIMKMPVCLLVPNILILLFFHRTGEFKYLVEKLKRFLRR